MSTNRFKGALEENLLTVIVFSKQYASTIALEIQPELFSNRIYQKIATEALAYLEKYGEPPRTHIRDLLEQELTRGELAGEMLKIIAAMEELEKELQIEFVQDRLQEFIETRQLSNSIAEAADLLHQGKLTEAKDALNSKTDRVKGNSGAWLKDTSAWLSFMDREDSELLSSGIQALDERGVRPEKGTMLLLIAPPKSGKCIDGDELVLLPSGTRKRIADVVHDKDPYVVTFDEKNGAFVTAPVAQHWSNGRKPCVRLTTRSGRKIITTKAHLYLTPEGWRPVKNLVPNVDYVAVPRKMSALGSDIETNERLRLLAYLIADASLRKDVCYSKNDPIIRADFDFCVEEMGDITTWGPRGDCYIRGIIRGQNNTREWLYDLDLIDKKSKDKFVPKFIFTLQDANIAEFLRALFSSDGSIYGRQRPVIEYSAASTRLVEDIQHLLLRLGIVSHVSYFTAKNAGKEFPGYARLLIQDITNVALFLEKVGFIGEKAERADKLVSREYAPRRRKWIPISDSAYYDLVVSIEPVGFRDTYDLGVADYHNFVAADMIVHNSWYGIECGKINLLGYHKKVLHISLENSLRISAQRYTQSFLGMTKNEVNTLRVPIMTRDSIGHFSKFDFEQISPKSIAKTSKGEVAKKLKPYQNRGQLYLHHFPDGTLTVPQLDRFLDSLEKNEDFIPDIIILDFAEKMALDVNNLRVSTSRLFVSLRGMAVRRNIALVTMSQGNRSSITSRLVRGHQVAEDIGKLGHADIILTYSQTAEEKEEGLARILVEGARDAEDGWIALITQSYKTGQFCLDSCYFTKVAESEVARLTGEEDD